MKSMASRADRDATGLEGAEKSFGKVKALGGVDLRLNPGEVTALLGPNGAGKTTAVRLLIGLSRPDRGTVRVLGGSPLSTAVRCRMGAMLQIAGVPPTLRVDEHLDLFRSYYPAPMSLERLKGVAGLEDLGRRPYGELSGGQQRRVQFALAICGDPEILFLDEPTTALDVEARQVLWGQIRGLVARGRRVLLTTHDLAEADALADRVAVLVAGRIVAEGTPAEIKRLGATRRVRCRTALSPEELAGWPDVREVVSKGRAMSLLVSEPEAVLRRLFAADPSLSELEVEGAALEDAFLSLTRPAQPVPEGMEETA